MNIKEQRYDGECININECERETDICQRGDISECLDNQGDYSCPCKVGYTQNGDNNKSCIAVGLPSYVDTSAGASRENI